MKLHAAVVTAFEKICVKMIGNWPSLFNMAGCTGADPGMGRSGPGPLFWQPNYANSALFRAISAIRPPLFTNLDTRPPLFTNPASAPGVDKEVFLFQIGHGQMVFHVTPTWTNIHFKKQLKWFFRPPPLYSSDHLHIF